MQFLLIITWLLLFINCTAAVYAAPAEPSALQFIPDNGSTGRGTPGSMGSTALLKILLSRLDNPSQASLDLILQKTDRVRVFAGGECKGKPITRIILLDSKDPAILAALRDALCIEEDPDSLGHDMCFGDPTIELLSGNKRLAVLGFHHARAVRFDKAWKFDAALKDGWRLVEWFAANGIKEPKLAQERERKETRRSSADLQKWILATPQCLRPYLGEMVSPSMVNVLVFVPEPAADDKLRASSLPSIKESPRQKQLMSVLAANFQDTDDKVLSLLQWYASGVGKWTGYPTYEELPSELLLSLPTDSIIHALNSKHVSEPELDGAARYFAWQRFRLVRPQDLALLDTQTALKHRLLEHCLRSLDEDKRKRAERAFSEPAVLKSADNSDR